jgi:hypothetical protein
MLLCSATTRIPSCYHSISVVVFPQVFFRGILHPSTFSNLSEAFLEPSWKFLSYRMGMLAPRPTLLFLDFGLSRNQQLRPRRIFLSPCRKEIQIPNCRHILGGKLDLLRCSRVCVVSGGEFGTFPDQQERSSFTCWSKSQKCLNLNVNLNCLYAHWEGVWRKGRMAPRVFNLAYTGGRVFSSLRRPLQPRETTSYIHGTGSWPCLSACLGIVKTKEVSCPCREIIYDTFVMQNPA